MSNGKKYDIFLSYNRLDKEWVEKIASKIESEYYGNRKLRVYLDDWDMVPGINMIKSMEEGLQQSRYVAPIISKNSIDAEWPNMEWSIAISSDPSGRRGTVIPLWLGGCEIPPSLKIRLVLYCNSDLLFKKSYTRLISILTNQKISRGQETTAEHKDYSEQFPLHYEDDVQEQLASNLLPVVDLPKTIWSGPTNFSNREVFELLRKEMIGVLPTFIIKNRQIFSFWDLNDRQCPFRNVLSSTNGIKTESIYDWMKTKEQSRWLIELLNKGLRNYCQKLPLRFDLDHKRYYFVPYNGQDRIVRWDTGKRKPTRTVVKKYKRNSGTVFWSHQSLKAQFTIIDEDIFLRLIPGWYFTQDGIEPLPSDKIGPLSTKWTAKEHNVSVFYHIRFWSSYLSKESASIEIPLGGKPCKVDTTPAVTELNKGLEGDINDIEKVFEIANEEISATEILREALEESQLETTETKEEDADE